MLSESLCRKVYGVPIADLPTYEVTRDDTEWCAVCTTKGDGNQSAVIYCTTCAKNYCVKHREVKSFKHKYIKWNYGKTQLISNVRW